MTDPKTEALQLAHEHMQIHMPVYRPGWNVYDAVAAALAATSAPADELNDIDALTERLAILKARAEPRTGKTYIDPHEMAAEILATSAPSEPAELDQNKIQLCRLGIHNDDMRRRGQPCNCAGDCRLGWVSRVTPQPAPAVTVAADPIGWLNPETGSFVQTQHAWVREDHFPHHTVPLYAHPAPSAAPAVRIFDDRPQLHIGDSSFEGWYQSHCCNPPANPKQSAREAYAAGMRDPLVSAPVAAQLVGVRSASRILPTYFVQHPDGSYTPADPQPEPIVMFTDPPVVEYTPPGPLQWEDGDAPTIHAPVVGGALKIQAPKAQPATPAEPKCGGREYCARMPFCGCGGPDPLADRDPTKGSKEQGLFNKFAVRRTDGSDAPGGKHHGCEYFVLDTTHDAFAKAALTAYAEACRAAYPALFADLWSRYDLALWATPPTAVVVPAELSDETIDAACVAWNRCILYGKGTDAGIQAARAILAASKEKAS